MITLQQYECLQGFFLYVWGLEEDKRKKIERRADFNYWANILDRAGISYPIQNKVARLAEKRENGFLSLRDVFKKNGIEVVIT